MYTKHEILDFISKNKSFLQKQYHISKIGLLGSFSRDEQSTHSDIDLIVEFEENTNNLYDIKIEIRKFFKNQFNLNVDICREKYIKPRTDNVF